MKRTICLLLCTVFILLIGCSMRDPLPSSTVAQTENPTTVPTGITLELPYDLYQKNEQWFLTFNDTYRPINGCEYVDTPQFSSIEEMRTAIRTGDFTATELWAIENTFAKDAQGNILVCNFEKLYVPTLPDGLVFDYLFWRGEALQFECTTENPNYLIILTLNDDEGYKVYFDRYYENYFDYVTVKITEHTTVEDRNAEVYYCESSTVRDKIVKYVLRNDSKTIYVREKYVIGNTENMPDGFSELSPSECSDIVPRSIFFAGNDNGQEFYGFLYSLSERPSEEFLLQLGVKPYAGTETE